jgi:hypothetical protein
MEVRMESKICRLLTEITGSIQHSILQLLNTELTIKFPLGFKLYPSGVSLDLHRFPKLPAKCHSKKAFPLLSRSRRGKRRWRNEKSLGVRRAANPIASFHPKEFAHCPSPDSTWLVRVDSKALLNRPSESLH